MQVYHMRAMNSKESVTEGQIIKEKKITAYVVDVSSFLNPLFTIMHKIYYPRHIRKEYPPETISLRISMRTEIINLQKVTV